MPGFFSTKNGSYSGFAYESVSASTVARTNSSTFINSSTVSQVTCFSDPSLEYRYTVRFTGSTTQRERYSSCIGSFRDYLGIIARSGARVKHFPLESLLECPCAHLLQNSNNQLEDHLWLATKSYFDLLFLR